MTDLQCAREADLLDAIASNRWPTRVDEDLRTHIAACGACADLAVVASALRNDRDAALMEAASLPPAGLVWLRAQARGRADAARAAARPVTIMQAAAMAAATAVVSLLIGLLAVWVWTRRESLHVPLLADAAGLEPIGFAVHGVLLAIALWLVLAPVAVYLLAAEE
jgi:hypothetical protein